MMLIISFVRFGTEGCESYAVTNSNAVSLMRQFFEARETARTLGPPKFASQAESLYSLFEVAFQEPNHKEPVPSVDTQHQREKLEKAFESGIEKLRSTAKI
ncbi:hypothetical protein I6E74_00750 [Salinibacterium sp. SWN139]|uniref:hypothetical protein n=1 Tax=Salinibacterium sp. SWN139 TaxID=2792055 RepID=UPI0018CED3B3|nr:hypothetical protein [Salinibacterium sp. SWN139]MBH0052695.1 hypothetical protein [Salinibacterium sp. SWN139]